MFPIPADGPTYESYPIPVVMPWAAMPDRVPDRFWGLLAAFAVGARPAVPPRLLGRQAAFLLSVVRGASPPGPDEEAMQVFRDQFASRANPRSSKLMVRQTPVWGHGYVYDDP